MENVGALAVITIETGGVKSGGPQNRDGSCLSTVNELRYQCCEARFQGASATGMYCIASTLAANAPAHTAEVGFTAWT